MQTDANVTIVHATSDAELAVWADTAARTADRPGTLDDLRRSIEHTPEQLRAYALVDGVPAGTTMAIADSTQPAGSMALSVRVIDQHRQRGIGTALHADAATWMRAHSGARFLVTTRDTQPDAIAFWEHRGCSVVNRDIVVALDLGTYVPVAPTALHATITSLAERPDLLRDVYDIGAATWGDIPSAGPSETISFEQWQHFLHADLRDHPESLFVAIVDGHAVGYAHLELVHVAADQGWHGFTGVLREQRGRGIAMQLKLHMLAWAKQRGLATLLTGNHEDNAAMRRINERLGYRVRYTRLTLAGELD